MITDYQTKALLIAIGKNSEAAVGCINHLSPELLCFFLQESEKETIEALVQPKITKMPLRWDWILTPDSNSGTQSHKAITKNLPDILKAWNVKPGELVVDFNEATPAMAAAVALASRTFTAKVVQLGMTNRAASESKTIIVGGEPKTIEEYNLWNEEAVAARQEVAQFFNRGAYSAATWKFRQIERLVSGSFKPLYHALSDVSEGYALWETFHYREAWEKLKTSLKTLELASVWGGPPGLPAVLGSIKTNASFLESIVLDPDEVKHAVALDLLAHAKRRAVQDHNIEVAMQTLIRSLEAFAQDHLLKQYKIKTWDVQVDQLPQPLQEPCQAGMLDDTDGKYKLTLQAQFRTLAELNNPMGQQFVTEWPKMKTLFDSANQSILGHGFHATKLERFHQLYTLVLKLTKVDESSLPRFPVMTL